MSDQAVGESGLYLLECGGAHLHFDQAIADLSGRCPREGNMP